MPPRRRNRALAWFLIAQAHYNQTVAAHRSALAARTAGIRSKVARPVRLELDDAVVVAEADMSTASDQANGARQVLTEAKEAREAMRDAAASKCVLLC